MTYPDPARAEEAVQREMQNSEYWAPAKDDPCAKCGQPMKYHGIWPTYVRTVDRRRYDLGHAFVPEAAS